MFFENCWKKEFPTPGWQHSSENFTGNVTEIQASPQGLRERSSTRKFDQTANEKTQKLFRLEYFFFELAKGK